MADRRRNFEQILQEKSREITDFSNAMEDVFARAAQDIRKDFLKELDTILKNDLNNFQRKLVAELTRSGLELLAPRIEGVFASTFGNTLGTSLGRIAREGDIDIGGVISERFPVTGSGGGGSAVGLESALSKVVFSAITTVLSRSRTKTTSFESERSREAAAQFRASRGQAQAQAAREISRGRRNL